MSQFGDGSLCNGYLRAINQAREGDMTLWKNSLDCTWLMHLWASCSDDFNEARVAVSSDTNKFTLLYVQKTLQYLATRSSNASPRQMDIVAQVLAWSEVTKCGMPKFRHEWKGYGIGFTDHAQDSARLYWNLKGSCYDEPVAVIVLLIQMHGAFGQYVQGEITPDGTTLPFTSESGIQTLKDICMSIGFPFEEFCGCFALLSECVLAGVSESLVAEHKLLIEIIAKGGKLPYYDVDARILKLCGSKEPQVVRLSAKSRSIIQETDIWYADGSFKAMGLEKTVLFLNALTESIPNIYGGYIADKGCPLLQVSPMISLREIQQGLYFYSNCHRYVDYCMMAMLERAYDEGCFKDTEHVCISFEVREDSAKEIRMTARLTQLGRAIDEFYRTLVLSDITHNKAILAVFDQLGYRSDIFDRVGNEDTYLQHMNNAADDKQKLLRYISDGQRVLDVGPGGGVFLELIQQTYPLCKLCGADISTEVCKRLEDKSASKGYSWNILHADFFSLLPSQVGHFDAIVFCSIIHEIFSYGEYAGHRYNKDVIPEILRAAANLLYPGGRIIIRDGIAAEQNPLVLVKFIDEELESLACDYIGQFKGFNLEVEGPKYTETEHVYRMPYNSMMELLYTVTWGRASLPFEVEEWYGYYSKKDWLSLADRLKSDLDLIYYNQYLQPGYPDHLKDKVILTDSYGKGISFPDSNAIVVFQKKATSLCETDSSHFFL